MENNQDLLNDSPKNYWKTLQQWEKDPQYNEWLEKEFMNSPYAVHEEEMKDGFARREFLKLMGASLALSSFACIRRPTETIVPYVKKPVEVTHGVSNFYASSLVDQGEVFGLLVKTREGRPIKLEGNPSHPSNKGALSARAHGHLLNLYDPNRLKGPVKRNPDETTPFRKTQNPLWADLDKDVQALVKEGGVVLLTGSLASPSTEALVSDFCRATGASHVQWDAINHDEIRKGQSESYGSSLVPRLRLDRARMLVTIDSDLLGTHLYSVEAQRLFAQNRRPSADMARLVAFESLYSLTGANSDFRVRIRPSQQVSVAMGLAYEIVVKMGQSRYAQDGTVKAALEPFKNVAQDLGIEAELFARIAADLWKNAGKSLVVAGGLTGKTSSAVELQIAVNFLNSLLNNDGVTVDFENPVTSFQGSDLEMLGLIEKMNAGQVKTLIVHRANPVYALPSGAGFVEALKKVKTLIYTGDRSDETGSLARFLAPDHHSLENWGDHQISRGIVSLQQPTIRPLYDTRSFQDSLLAWSGGKISGTWYEYLREFWKRNYWNSFGAGKSFEDFWLATLQSGYVGGVSEKTSSGRGFRAGALSGIRKSKATELELALYQKVGIGDGSLANVGWLHELPDPVTKITWDCYASVSPNYAKEKGVAEGQILKLSVGSQTVQVPAHIQPGQHDSVIGLAVGYGRTQAGDVGNGIGINGYILGECSKGAVRFAGLPVQVEKTSSGVELACTAGHDSMEGRAIVIEATLQQYLKKEDANIHRHPIVTMWTPHEYKGHKWGMAIDLSVCTGCSACVVACQSENNIPVVGKKLILRGREMQWIRIDRYYQGEPSNPTAVFQPMLCQHCDNAPCETVCPVAATTHSPEGLNEMTYNRCVGTRYCSNNCPYKVRRFNWFNYAKVQQPQSLALNPEVTVRARGVMEKCTFCVQRIHEGKNKARDNNTTVKDGDIVTACQQTCPTQAIVFGDMNDPESRVSKMFKQKRTYSVLEELNAVPNVRYQTKIRNSDYTPETHNKGGHA